MRTTTATPTPKPTVLCPTCLDLVPAVNTTSATCGWCSWQAGSILAGADGVMVTSEADGVFELVSPAGSFVFVSRDRWGSARGYRDREEIAAGDRGYVLSEVLAAARCGA